GVPLAIRQGLRGLGARRIAAAGRSSSAPWWRNQAHVQRRCGFSGRAERAAQQPGLEICGCAKNDEARSPEFHFVAIRTDLQRELTAIYRAAIAAVDPARLVGQALDGTTSASRQVSELIVAATPPFVLS